MRIRLPLTAWHDLDLLSLNNIEEFDFKGWVREVLREYVRNGNVVRMALPPLPDGDAFYWMKVTLSITLDKRKDMAIMNWLKIIKPKQKSRAIKALLRCSLESPCFYSFYCFYPPPILPAGIGEGRATWAKDCLIVDNGNAEMREEYLRSRLPENDYAPQPSLALAPASPAPEPVSPPPVPAAAPLCWPRRHLTIVFLLILISSPLMKN